MAEIDYFFEFNSEASALADSVVGPFITNNPSVSRQNIWGFDLASNLPISRIPGQQTFYWCMIAQGASNSALQSHPNCKFFLVLPSDVLYENMGNIGFVAVSVATFKAIYAKQWSIGVSLSDSNSILTSVSGLALTDINGDAAIVTMI